MKFFSKKNAVNLIAKLKEYNMNFDSYYGFFIFSYLSENNNCSSYLDEIFLNNNTDLSH